MFHLISLTSPVSRGAKQQLRESQHSVEQSWLTWCLPEGSALTLTGIVCEHVKQWETSQLTATLSCSHCQWQQCRNEAAAALVWDSVQTALREERSLSEQSLSVSRISLWQYLPVRKERITTCACHYDLFFFSKYSSHFDYPGYCCGLGLKRSRRLLLQKGEWLSTALDPSQASHFSFPPM